MSGYTYSAWANVLDDDLQGYREDELRQSSLGHNIVRCLYSRLCKWMNAWKRRVKAEKQFPVS